MTARSELAAGPPGLGAAISAEWAKARTLRSVKINLLLGVFLGIGFSLLLSLLIGLSYDEMDPASSELNPVSDPMGGGLFMTIFLAAVGVNLFSSENSSGMIRLTLTATPRRGRVLAAKAIVVAIITAVASAFAALVMFLSGQILFVANDLPSAALTDPDVVRMLAGIVLLAPVYPLLGLALAVLLRSTAPAIVAVLGLIFLPTMFGGLFPQWWQDNIMSLMPGSAVNRLTTDPLIDSSMNLAPALAVVVVLAWVTAALALATVVLNRRDA